MMLVRRKRRIGAESGPPLAERPADTAPGRGSLRSAQEEEARNEAANKGWRIDEDAPVLFADANKQRNGNEEHRAESELDRECTWGDEPAFALGKDASKPGLHVRPSDCLGRGADTESNGNQADAGERREHPSRNRDHDGDVEDGAQERRRADQNGQPSQVAATPAERRGHEPLQDSADEGEEANQGGERWRCAKRGDQWDGEAVSIKCDGDGIGDGKSTEGGVAACEESPPVGDRLTHRP